MQDTGRGFSPLPIHSPFGTDNSPPQSSGGHWSQGRRALRGQGQARCLWKLQFLSMGRRWGLELCYLVSFSVLGSSGRAGGEGPLPPASPSLP